MLTPEIQDSVETPAFVYDEEGIRAAISDVRSKLGEFALQVLFPLKCFTIYDALCFMADYVDGFSASSLFEAELAREILGNDKQVHITMPGMRPDEVDRIAEVCDLVSFNSLSQFRRYHKRIFGRAQIGLRVNPKISFVKDCRYDPCRKFSKLGIPLAKLTEMAGNLSEEFKAVAGLHFHTNCESANFHNLLRTIEYIEQSLSGLLAHVDWVNLGGGYLFESPQNIDALVEYVDRLKGRYHVEIIVEPGKGIVGSSGYMISSVLDMFESDGRQIAVLDTSVNHMPEVFEYQYKPDVAQATRNGKYRYTLAGATCLAGDLFGEYKFEEPLEIGSRIVFENAGAYTLVKAHMFNGVNLPTICALTAGGRLEQIRTFDYEDFRSRCGRRDGK